MQVSLAAQRSSVEYRTQDTMIVVIMLQIYRTGITFIYTVRLVGDGWDEGEIERS